MDAALSPSEQFRLTALEAQIAPHLESWITVGLALLEIKQSRLYRAAYPSFEAYCKERWQMGRSRAYQLISGAPIAEALDDPAATEGAIRPLTGLSPDDAALVWRVVKETAPDGNVTGRHVKAVTNVLKEILHTGAVDDGDGGQLPVSQASADHLKAAITEAAYEAMQRQAQRLADSAIPSYSFTAPVTPALLAQLPEEHRAALYAFSEVRVIVKPIR